MGLREIHPAETEVNPAPKWSYDKKSEGGRWVNWAFFMDGDLTLEDCRSWEIKCGSVWLNVYDHNARAQAVYRALGFRDYHPPEPEASRLTAAAEAPAPDAHRMRIDRTDPAASPGDFQVSAGRLPADRVAAMLQAYRAAFKSASTDPGTGETSYADRGGKYQGQHGVTLPKT